jgi:hypothetical protein
MANKTVTVRPSGGTYTTFAAAITGEIAANANLVTMAGILTISMEGTWTTDDSTVVRISGFTTSAAYFVRVIDNSGGTYRLRASAADRLLRLDNAYTEIIGIRVENTQTTTGICVNIGSANCHLDKVKLRGGRDAIWVINNGATVPHTIINTIARGYTRYGVFGNQDPTLTYISNCNFAGGTHGLYCSYAEIYTIKNSYFGNSSTADLFNDGSGTINLTTTRTEDGSLSTPTSAYSTATFTNVTAGNEDFSLPSGSGLIDAGSDLSADAGFPFNWDITGATRAAPWDVGAYEYVSSGQSCTPLGVTSTATVGRPACGQLFAAVILGVISTGIVGSPSTAQIFNVAPLGVTSAAIVGSPIAGQSFAVIPLGVTSTATVGRPSASQEQSCVPLGVIITGTVGSPVILQTFNVSPLGVESTGVTGSPAAGQIFNVTPPGVTSTGVTGSPAAGQIFNVTPPGVESTGVTGSPAAGQIFNVTPPGVTSTGVTGAPAAGQIFNVTPLGVTSTGVTGAPGIGQIFNAIPLGVTSTGIVGAPSVGQGQYCTPLGVTSTAEVSSPSTGQAFAVVPLGVESTGIVGSPNAFNGQVCIPMGATVTGETGRPAAGQVFSVVPRGVTSTGTVGRPAINPFDTPGVPRITLTGKTFSISQTSKTFSISQTSKTFSVSFTGES